jgi:hypothetical protein
MVEIEKHIENGSCAMYADREVPTLFSTGPQIPKEELIQQHQTRGLKTKSTYLE